MTPIIGIGASAGGIDAFRAFFRSMPANCGMAFIVVLHLPPDRRSLLPEILSRWTSMRVIEAADQVPPEADTVYIPAPDTLATLHDGMLVVRRPPADQPRIYNPIDVLFDSLAADQQEDAIGIVLSGTGSDGALGLKAIKERGGFTIVQSIDGSDNQHAGMPDEAIATGAIDMVLPVTDMPAALQRIVADHNAVAPAELGSDDEPHRLRICNILRAQIGHDFTHYKVRTFMRRVQRRMQVAACDTIESYANVLDDSRDECTALFRDLLIGVTSFFRDSETFLTLERIVVPRLFAGRDPSATVRLWVPGCATGEEAYSLAILLREHMDRMRDPPTVQVFATDINEPAITTARAGRYPATLLEGMSPARRARFFNSVEGGYAVTKSVRELCTFSTHSLVRDPPFSRMDLISCRNLLIYLDAELQSTIIPAFHYSLLPSGILLLGSSETVARHEQLFEPLDKAHRIFQRRATATPPLRLVSPVVRDARLSTSRSGGGDVPDNVRLVDQAQGFVLDRFAPPFVIADRDGNVVHYSSGTGRFLEAAAGAPNRGLFAMARRELRVALQSVFRRAVDSGTAAEQRWRNAVAERDQDIDVRLIVQPLGSFGGENMFLVLFDGTAGTTGRRTPRRAVTPRPPSDQVEQELRDTREQLQSVTEEHETAVEELRSANEELHSVNEELQSTNEELETSREEIQSINEELQTVNAQLTAKLDELDHANADLRNLFDSTEVATVFLNRHLVIRSFTAAAADIYKLIPSDTGRPLTDIVTNLRYETLRADVREVLETLQTLERRLIRLDGEAHFLMRILPYRNEDSTVDGVLMTFVDVTSIVRAEQHQRLLVDELNHRVKNMLSVIISLATQTMRRANTPDQFSEVFLGRIHALTAAYTLVSRDSWLRIPLRDILVEELRPFMATHRTNIILEGPSVTLEPRGALAIGMAIHELATNAVKYGALSVPEGDVSVAWHLEKGLTEQDGDVQQLVIGWVERNGPPVRPPEQRGFGMTLIERGISHDLSGHAVVEFAPEGLRVVLRAPLVEPVAGEPAATEG